jgi:hypothetical protein
MSSIAVQALDALALIVAEALGCPCTICGAPPSPAGAPCPSAWLSYDSIRADVDGPGVALSQRGLTMNARVVVYPKTDDPSPRGRIAAVLGVADQVVTAIHANRGLGGLVLDSLAAHDATPPDVGASGGLQAEIQVEVRWIGGDSL